MTTWMGVFTSDLCPPGMMCKLDCPWLSPYWLMSLGGWPVSSREQLDLADIWGYCWELGELIRYCFRGPSVVSRMYLHRLCVRIIRRNLPRNWPVARQILWSGSGFCLHIGVVMCHRFVIPVCCLIGTYHSRFCQGVRAGSLCEEFCAGSLVLGVIQGLPGSPARPTVPCPVLCYGFVLFELFAAGVHFDVSGPGLHPGGDSVCTGLPLLVSINADNYGRSLGVLCVAATSVAVGGALGPSDGSAQAHRHLLREDRDPV